MSSALTPSASNAIFASTVGQDGHMSGIIQLNIVFAPSKMQG
jgi:hypothetical protein